jgi:ribosomal protein S16
VVGVCSHRTLDRRTGGRTVEKIGEYGPLEKRREWERVAQKRIEGHYFFGKE